jgi:predicted TIM-barrel fold metal-dependent hydrolase
MRVLIDFHVHLYDEEGYGEALAETARNLGLDRLCICGGEPRYGLASNAEARRLASSYPELFVPFARLTLGRDGPDQVEYLKRHGFEGLRVCGPPAPYDDEAFFPVYEAAQALRMPILFHTALLPATPLDRSTRSRAAYMRPIHLDTLARWFPDLTLVGSALGRPWYEEAVETMRHHQNVYFDLSGDVFRLKGTDFLCDILRPAQASLWEDRATGDLCGRLVFGSAVRHTEIASVERDYQRAFRSMGLGQEQIESAMGQTAATLLDIPPDD